MNKRMLYWVVVFVTITSIAGASEMKGIKYVPIKPYKASVDEIALAKVTTKIIYPRDFEEPTKEVVKKRLTEAIKLAEEEESRIRYMVEKGMVRTVRWNRRDSGSVKVPSQKTIYKFSFKFSSLKEIQQMDKTVYEDKMYGEKDLSKRYSFTFHGDVDCVRCFSYGYGPSQLSLDFYPNQNLKRFSATIDDKYYSVTWNEEGKLEDEYLRTLKQ